jgi:Uma2 family endonuclease
MYAVISRDKIQLPPGTVVRMPGSWQDYCALRDSRGDGSIPRIKYRNGEILLMSPMPRHGREAHLLARIVEALLDSKDRNYEAFTPITMDIPESGGIEPDYCFYIDHWQAALGKDRINWQIDPPPDLVIEIDVTTYTAAVDYLPYRVPEVWLFKKNRLTIHHLEAGELEAGEYVQRETSLFFPGVDLKAIAAECLQTAAERGTGVALRELRSRLS